MNTNKLNAKVMIADIFLAYTEIYKEDGKNGAEMLRDCVKFLNERPESWNDNKTPLQLLHDFADMVRD
jgi:hypothetical protein